MCYFQGTDEEIPPEGVGEVDKEPEEGNQQPGQTAGDTTGGNANSTNTAGTTGGNANSTDGTFKQPNTGVGRSRQANTPILKEAVSVMKEIQTQKRQKPLRDDCSVFGEHVGNKLRKLTNPKVQATVQHIICNTLFDAEMGKFDQPQRMYGQPQHSQSHSTYDNLSHWQMTQQLPSPSLSNTNSNTPSDADSNYNEENTEDIDRILHSFN